MKEATCYRMVKTTSNTRYRKASVNTFPIFSVVIIPLITMEGRGLRGFFFFFFFPVSVFVCLFVFVLLKRLKSGPDGFLYIIICTLFLLECDKQHTPSLSTSSTKRCMSDFFDFVFVSRNCILILSTHQCA